MADKAEKKPEAAPAAGDKRDAGKKPAAGAPAGAAAAAGGGAQSLLSKTPVMLGGVMLLEAVVLFAGFKFLGGGHPKEASGSELVTESSEHGKGEGHGG